MNITLNFALLYLIPVMSFALAVGTYLKVYGRALALEQKIINFTFSIIIVGFIASSSLAIILVTHFLPNEVYSGVVFSIIAWFLDAIVVGLCLIFFYGVGNP